MATLGDPRHETLRAYLVAARKKAGLRQIDLAAKLQREQSYVSHVETGQKLVGAIELLEWAEALGFDPASAMRRLRLRLPTAKGPKGRAGQ